jgi:hypothetical protein
VHDGEVEVARLAAERRRHEHRLRVAARLGRQVAERAAARLERLDAGAIGEGLDHDVRVEGLAEVELALEDEGVPVLLLDERLGVLGRAVEVLEADDAALPGVGGVRLVAVRLQQHQVLLERPGALAARVLGLEAVGVDRRRLGAKHHVQALAGPHDQAGVLHAWRGGVG